jgi:hypothetical protein
VERDFRSLKTVDLELRPIHHRLDGRVRAHVLVCMLACYLAWHLRRALAPLCFTDQAPPTRTDPVAPAQRSADAVAKASRQHLADGTPVHSFRSLLDHLGTLTRNQVHFPQRPRPVTTELLATPTPTQRRAFDLGRRADPAHPQVVRTHRPGHADPPSHQGDHAHLQHVTSV